MFSCLELLLQQTRIGSAVTGPIYATLKFMTLRVGSPESRIVVKALAGLQAGTLGGLVMLVWFALHSMTQNQSWFAVPNLLASTFYGDAAFRSGFGRVTLAGGALHLCASAAVGVLYGLLFPERQGSTRVLLTGVVAGLAWYYLCYGAFWRLVNPLVPLYSSQRTMVIAHVLYGACLAFSRRFLRALEAPSVAPLEPAIVDGSNFPLE
jgi:hypothetical protein